MGNKINIQQLNADFGIANQIEFVSGKNELPFIQINTTKATALISVYAGQVLSYKPVSESVDLMFISENAYFQDGKAIKGGIPICWPWFGAADSDKTELTKKPDHGFVRNSFWSVVSTKILANGDTKIVLGIKDSERTREIWPYSFYLSLEILIGDSLCLELLTRNTGNQTFSISEALHSYFNVGEASQVTVSGLEHTEYLDKKEDFVSVCQVGEITISDEIDHIHTDIKHELLIDDPAFERQIKINSSGNKNVVVWNPWVKGSANMTDLENDDYKHFICVEVANATAGSVEIPPSAESKIDVRYTVL